MRNGDCTVAFPKLHTSRYALEDETDRESHEITFTEM